MYIKDSELKSLMKDEKEYRFGRFIDVHNILERMTISLDESHQCYRINARILDNGQTYVMTIKISFDGDLVQTSCSCRNGLRCRHTVAVLLFVRQLDIHDFPYFYEKNQNVNKEAMQKELEKKRQQKVLDKKYHESDDLIDFYKNQLLRESLIPLSSKQYQLKVFVKKVKGQLQLSIKVYNQQQGYIVKNIETFLNAIKNHESLKYGKSFEFVHSEDVFDDDSLDLLSFIKECFMSNKLIQEGCMKYLIVEGDDLDNFYQTMVSLPSYYSDIAFDQKNNKIGLELEKKEKSYILDFKDSHAFEDAMVTDHGIYEFENDILYCYDFQNKDKMTMFVKKLLETRTGLYIEEKSLMDFYKYVLLDLSDDVDLHTHVFDDYCQENMINLYGDMTKDDQICIQLEYIYDDKIEYGFDENNHHISKEADLIEKYLEPYIEDVDDHILYLEYDHEFAYRFMKEGLPYLSKYCQVYVTDALKVFHQQQNVQFQVGVQLHNGLLSIKIDSLDIDKQELMNILKAYKKKRKFYKLDNGKVLSLENKEFKEFDELTTSLHLDVKDLQQDIIDIPSYRMFELEQMKNKNTSIRYENSDEYNQWLDGLKTPQPFEVPERYQKILREYQVEGYQWLRLMEYYQFGGILADDMGLGKTLQMITYLESMSGRGTHLVIAPASLILNWQDEIDKFSSHLKVLCIYGSKKYREECIQQCLDYQVIITSYDYLRRDIDLYENIEFHTVILDEAQYIKNPKTRNAICVKKLKSKQRFALTGTPIENSLAELWSIFDFLMPRYLYNYSYFLENFEKPIVKDQDLDKQEKLKQMITPFVLRRNKKDVLTELPPKIEQTLYLQFSEEEEKLYLANLASVNKSLQEKLKIQQLGRIDILAMLTRLRQLCQDPRLLYDTYEEPSSKLKGCMELIHSLKDNNKKILLFCSFTSVLDLIQEQCHREHISYYVLDGKTSKDNRKKMVDAFQKDDTTLFLISLKAGGSGLNLTSAQAVIHFDPWWNMSAKNQATDRAYRMGQKDSVQVFSLIMKNSIEEKIMDLQKMKKNLADTFVEGNEGQISSMSIDEMKALFEI